MFSEVEFNVNGLPAEGVREVDFDVKKGCFVLVFEDGSVKDVYIDDAERKL